MTYLDILSRKNKRSRGGDDSDSDDGPPPDPDEPAPLAVPKKEKKPSGDAREVQVSARKVDEKGALQPFQGGLSTVRREMLVAIRSEEDENWEDLEFCDGTVRYDLNFFQSSHTNATVYQTHESEEAFEAVFSHSEELLECKSDVTGFLKGIEGL